MINLKQRTQRFFVFVCTVKENNHRPSSSRLLLFLQTQNQQRQPSLISFLRSTSQPSFQQNFQLKIEITKTLIWNSEIQLKISQLPLYSSTDSLPWANLRGSLYLPLDKTPESQPSVVEIDSIELNHQTKKKIQNLIKKEKENRSYACMLMLMIVEISNQTSSCDGGELLIEGFSTGFPSSTVSGTETSKTNEWRREWIICRMHSDRERGIWI